MSEAVLVFVKQGGSVKKVTLAKAKRLVHEGYELGDFVKGVWVPKDESDVKKQNIKLKSDNKKTLAANDVLKAANVALQAEIDALKAK